MVWGALVALAFHNAGHGRADARHRRTAAPALRAPLGRAAAPDIAERLRRRIPRDSPRPRLRARHRRAAATARFTTLGPAAPPRPTSLGGRARAFYKTGLGRADAPDVAGRPRPRVLQNWARPRRRARHRRAAAPARFTGPPRRRARHRRAAAPARFTKLASAAPTRPTSPAGRARAFYKTRRGRADSPGVAGQGAPIARARPADPREGARAARALPGAPIFPLKISEKSVKNR